MHGLATLGCDVRKHLNIENAPLRKLFHFFPPKPDKRVQQSSESDIRCYAFREKTSIPHANYYKLKRNESKRIGVFCTGRCSGETTWNISKHSAFYSPWMDLRIELLIYCFPFSFKPSVVYLNLLIARLFPALWHRIKPRHGRHQRDDVF